MKQGTLTFKLTLPHYDAPPHRPAPTLGKRVNDERTPGRSRAPKPESVTNAGNKTRQRTARWSRARLPLALPVRDVTLICGGRWGWREGREPYGLERRKGGEGAEKLTLDISHLNAAAIIIHITVKLSDVLDRLNVRREAFLPQRIRKQKATLHPFFFVLLPQGAEIPTLVGKGINVNLCFLTPLSRIAATNCGYMQKKPKLAVVSQLL